MYKKKVVMVVHLAFQEGYRCNLVTNRKGGGTISSTVFGLLLSAIILESYMYLWIVYDNILAACLLWELTFSIDEQTI